MSDDRFSRNKRQYFTLDFSNVTERGLQPLIKAITKTGQQVVEVNATNRTAKRAGLATKSAKVILASGQTVTVRIGQDGDIAQTLLGRTVIPVQAARTADDWAKDTVKHVQANQARFDKALARRLKTAKDTSEVKPASRSLKARTAEATTARNTERTNVESLQAQISKKETVITEKSTRFDHVKSSLETARAEGNSLMSEIAELEGDID